MTTKRDRDIFSISPFTSDEFHAMEFVAEHPLGIDLPESFYTSVRSVKPQKKINVFFLGFGDADLALMKAMAEQYQFAEISPDGFFRNHPVTYHIYDISSEKRNLKKIVRQNNRLNKISYVDLPPCEEVFRLREGRVCNFSSAFFSEIEKFFTDPDSFGYVVISLANDAESLALAERFAAFFPKKNYRIFVRKCGKIDNISRVCTFFGTDKTPTESDLQFNAELNMLARKINSFHSADFAKNKSNLSVTETCSNLSHALGIFFKMGLFKLKFVKADEPPGDAKTVSSALFLRRVGCPETGIVDYNKYFQINTRTMLGFSEHSRWAAFYLLTGFSPMPFSEIKIKNIDGNSHADVRRIRRNNDVEIVIKDLQHRRHCCLTNFGGLDILHKHLLNLCAQNGIVKTLDDVETYKYDFMAIDNLLDMMSALGYVLAEAE